MTQPSLETLCRTWQERLLLQDWTVDIKFRPMDECWGLCEFYDDCDRASVTINPKNGPESYEFYVVHELLHLRQRKLKGTNHHIENAINLLTRSFLKAYKRK